MRVLYFHPDAASIEVLKTTLNRHPKAYMRERASALLQIASGKSGQEVAELGLLKHRRASTVYDWVHRYKAQGLDGLLISSGRGRKPSFFPPQ